MLRDYREQCKQLKESLDAIRRKEQDGDNGTATTGINTSILPEDTISVVQSTITTASEMWLDHITKMCLKHTQEMLEQRRENDIVSKTLKPFSWIITKPWRLSWK